MDRLEIITTWCAVCRNLHRQCPLPLRDGDEESIASSGRRTAFLLLERRGDEIEKSGKLGCPFCDVLMRIILSFWDSVAPSEEISIRIFPIAPPDVMLPDRSEKTVQLYNTYGKDTVAAVVVLSCMIRTNRPRIRSFENSTQSPRNKSACMVRYFVSVLNMLPQ